MDLRRGLPGGSEEAGAEFLVRLAEPSHIVQFYENEEFLCDLVGDYLAAGMTSGEKAIVFATEAHRQTFRSFLAARGIEVDRACAAGQLQLFDARETLTRFMVDGMPDWERFQSVIGAAIDRSKSRSDRRPARVRAYGEMVDLLWREGNARAAIRLEELWNELGRNRSFSLLCAYVMGSFYKEGQSDGHPATLHQMCRTHANLVATESRERGGSPPPRRDQFGVTSRRAQRLSAEIEQRKQVESALRASLRELRRAEEALRESQRELQEFVDNAAEGMEWLDTDGNILWANRAQLDLLGYGADEYIGRHVGDFHADQDAVDEFFARLGGDAELRDHEARVRCKDGSVKHVLIDANVFRKGGKVVHTRCFTRDITARKRAHEALMRLQAITAGLSEARTQAEVLDVVTRHTISASGALGASVYLMTAEADALELARAVGYSERVLDRSAKLAQASNR